MLIYFIIPIYLFVLSLINPKSKMIRDISFIMTALFLCTTYFNGSDWRQYELEYNLISYTNFYLVNSETGFKFYMLMFKILGFNYWNFFIITKLLCFFIFYKKIVSNSKNVFFVLMLFYSYMSLYLFIDCPLRNLIAISLFFIAENYLLKKKYIIYYLVILLGFLFHESIFFAFLLPLIQKIYKINRYIVLILMFSITLFLLDQNFLIKIIKLLPLNLDYRVLKYFGGEYFKQTFFTLGSIEKLIIIVYVLFNKNCLMKKDYKFKYIITMLIIFFIFYRISFTIEILSRLVLFVYVYYFFSIDYTIYYLLKKEKNIIIILFFIYSILIVNKLILKSYKYIPYTSYLTYILKEKPDYKYRSEYNYKKFYERTGKRIGDF